MRPRRNGLARREGPDLTLVSTKNIDLSNVTVDVRKGQRHTGEDCKVWPLGVPIAVPTIEAAIDQALDRVGVPLAGVL